MESASLITTEGPLILGYLTLALVLGVGTIVVGLLDAKTHATRRRNRVIRHARAGCSVCRATLRIDALGSHLALLEAEDVAEADVDAWLDYPTARNTTA